MWPTPRAGHWGMTRVSPWNDVKAIWTYRGQTGGDLGKLIKCTHCFLYCSFTTCCVSVAGVDLYSDYNISIVARNSAGTSDADECYIPALPRGEPLFNTNGERLNAELNLLYFWPHEGALNNFVITSGGLFNHTQNSYEDWNTLPPHTSCSSRYNLTQKQIKTTAHRRANTTRKWLHINETKQRYGQNRETSIIVLHCR